MSTHRALDQISRYLQILLYEGLSRDSDLGQYFTNRRSISLGSPAEVDLGSGDVQSQRLSLYLYRVAPNAHLNNRQKVPSAPGKTKRPPLSLDLHFLLTPFGGSPSNDLQIMGKAMEIIAAHPIISANFLESDLNPNPPEAGVILEQLDLEELTRIWNAFNEPYRLSASYLVRTISIDNRGPEFGGGPIEERLLDIHKMSRGEGE